jgi:two-component system LytT family response regulator
MKVRTLLIDDEPKSLSILENKIARLSPRLEVIGKTQDPEEGLELINQMKPDLVFLDIAMPKMSGFDLLEQIEDPSFEIIFATAFDEFAIDAIRYCAIGYLVKPIDNKDLVVAVEHAIQNMNKKNSLVKNQQLIENSKLDQSLKKIIIPDQEGFRFVKIQDIIRCAGKDGYTELYLLNGELFLSSYSIGYFVTLLKNDYFYSPHRSHLINMAHIEGYLNEGYVELVGNHKVPLSKSKKTDFMKQLKSI